MKRRQLITSDEARTTPKQHKKPCSDCPFSRGSLAGWIPTTPVEWAMQAHNEDRIECHALLPHQCAGAAIYRSNVCKDPRDKTLLVLPADKKLVFASIKEFLEHHEGGLK